MEKVFRMVHLISNESYLHSFQYKVVHRVLNCNKNLHKWKIKDSPVCIYCPETDSIEHHLFYCNRVQLLWKNIFSWLHKIFEPDNIEEPRICEIIFRVHIDAKNISPKIYCMNLVILLGKWYINQMRSQSKTVHFLEFCSVVKLKIEIYLTNFKTTKTLERVDGGIKKSLKMLLNTLPMI